MNRKFIGLAIIAVFAVVIVFGGIHYTLEIIEASSGTQAQTGGDYAPRLDADPREDPALQALKSVCLFH